MQKWRKQRKLNSTCLDIYIPLTQLSCWLFVASLDAVSCQFSETTWANNSSEFPLFLHFISARNAWTAVIVVLYIHRYRYMYEPQCLSQISLITQIRPKTTLTARCLSLRPLRYLRENNTEEDSINLHRRNPMSHADLADLADKTPNHKTAFTSNNLSFSAI